MVVCMIGGSPRPWEGRIRGLRNSCGSAADMACGSLPCLKATNNKKVRPYDMTSCKAPPQKAPPLKEGFGEVVCMIGGTPRP